MCNIKMQSEQKGASGGFAYAKTSLGVGFLHKNAYFLVKSEGICTINHVISYKRGGFQKPPCVIFFSQYTEKGVCSQLSDYKKEKSSG